MDERRRKVPFKVPSGIKSKSNEHRSPVRFKNLSDTFVEVYWIDYNGRPQLFTTLKPVERNDPGFTMVTFVSHPFVAIYKGKRKSLYLNDNRYFLPPNVESWNKTPLGWVNPKWHLGQEKDNEKKCKEITYDMDGSGAAEKYYEVLILPSVCMSLYKLSLLKTCELYSDQREITSLDIPSHLKREIEIAKEKYFFRFDTSGGSGVSSLSS